MPNPDEFQPRKASPEEQAQWDRFVNVTVPDCIINASTKPGYRFGPLELFSFSKLPQIITPKIKDPAAWVKKLEQQAKFNAWCAEKGYFPHSKYFEAWMAAVESNQ